MNNLQTSFHRLRDELTKHYTPEEAAVIAEMITEQITGLSRTQWITHPEIQLTATQQQLWNQYREKLLQDRPVQYVLGKTKFFGLDFFVDESVLIPRPETEELVQLCINIFSNRKEQDLNILDLGTGSGCIPIALKSQFPKAQLFGADISKDALKTAEKNAIYNGLKVCFLPWDLLRQPIPSSLPKMDFITSNPPYITQGEKESMAPNVLNYEPQEALFVTNEDPLQFYRKIEGIGRDILKSGGYLFFELNETYATEVGDFFEARGWIGELKKDFFGKERMGYWKRKE